MQNLTQKSHPKKIKPLRILQTTAIVGVAFVFALTSLVIFTNQTKAQNQSTTTSESATSTSSQEEISCEYSEELSQEQLQKRVDVCLSKIKEQEEAVSNLQSKERTVENRINQLNAEIRSKNLQIQSVELNLQKLNQDIYETQRSINRTQNRIKSHKEALSKSLQKIYETDKQSLIAILLKNDQVSDFFDSINNILLVQDNIQNSLNEVVDLRQNLIQEKEELSREKESVQSLKTTRERQKRQLDQAENEQQRLLSLTAQERKEEEKQLQEQRKTVTEIRNQILELVGVVDGQLTFEKAYDLAKYAEDITGTRAALTMSIVTQESDLGRNTGTCNRPGDDLSWKDIMPGPNDNSWRDDQSIYLAITNQLNIPPDSTPLSCPIGNGWGGAMGPSQFIPYTWADHGGFVKENGNWVYKASEDRIRQITGGDDISDPWNNKDAFVATALYINNLYNSNECKDYAKSLDHKYPRQELQEECAASKYYAGGNWKAEYYTYGIPVSKRAKEIQKDIDILEGN